MEMLLFGLFGVVMFIVGRMGILVYARSFFNDPKATMSADVLLALIKGPSSVPVVMCLILMIAGVYFIAIALYVIFAVGVTVFQSR